MYELMLSNSLKKAPGSDDVGYMAIMPSYAGVASYGACTTLVVDDLEENLYLFGGYNATGALSKDFTVYNFALKKWIALPKTDLAETRYVAGGYVNDKIYYISRQFIRIFDIATGTWSSKTGVNTGWGYFEQAKACVVGTTIYLMGYSDVYANGTGLVAYDTLTNKFTLVSKWGTALKAYVAVNHIAGKLYCQPLNANSLDVYDLSTNTWEIAPLAINLVGSNSVVLGTDIYYFGATSTAPAYTEVWKLNTVNRELTKLPSLPRGVSQAFVVARVGKVAYIQMVITPPNTYGMITYVIDK
jgi:hypothetical protein